MSTNKVGNMPVQQGEVRIQRIGQVPDAPTKPVKRTAKGYIISHSENGNHHCLSGGDAVERRDTKPGMQVFYAIIDKRERFYQDSASPHGEYEMNPGVYELRVSREFDPFAEQVRRVAD